MIGATTDAESDCDDVAGADGKNGKTVGTRGAKRAFAECDCKTNDATE